MGPFRRRLVLFLLLPLFLSSSSSSEIQYHPHCNSIVPEPRSVGSLVSPDGLLQFQGGSFSGGEKIFPDESTSVFSVPKSARLRSTRVRQTDSPGILQVQMSLILRGGSIYSGVRVSENSSPSSARVVGGVGRLNRVRPRSPRVFHQRGRISFELHGFWAAASGRLCAVGTSVGYSKDGNFLDLSVIVKLNYANVSTIRTSLVSGTIESLDKKDDSNYFDNITIIGFSDKDYKYTIASDGEKGLCSGTDHVKQKSLSLDKDGRFCSILQFVSNGGFELEYNGSCSEKSCGTLSGSNNGFLPKFMSVSGVRCADGGKMHLRFGFHNSSWLASKYRSSDESIFVSEGFWDGEENRLCLAACRVTNLFNSFGNVSTEDCTIRLSLWAPTHLSIRERSVVMGSIWTNKDKNDADYFETIGLHSLKQQGVSMAGIKYEYTQRDRVKMLCAMKDGRTSKGKRYPDGNFYGDMRFDMSVKNAGGKVAWGYATPITISDRFYRNSGLLQVSPDYFSIPKVQAHKVRPQALNISYVISFTLSPDFKWGGALTDPTSSSQVPIDISAEGIYNPEFGKLCMVGCRQLSLNNWNTSLDCEILIDIQFASLNPSAKLHLKGTIKSTRLKSDPFYFEPLELSSNDIYNGQAKEWLWRIDIEITMVLVSLTLACIFIGTQLLHVSKNPDVLPSASLLMLTILTLGHMIPLVLNFEAFFLRDRNRQNALMWSGGWLEVNEVVVRIATMVAFLLQFRLLQLTWSARLADGSRKDLWTSEKMTVYVCLPLYMIGGFIAGFVHWRTSSAVANIRLFPDARHSLWNDLRSYCGLILDGFLLPQVLFNLFSGSNMKTLGPCFYIGTSIVRLLPHAYDAYRSSQYVPRSNASFMYADPNSDLYSSAWDAVIPCAGLFFALLIYLQQRFGGARVLPRRFRQSLYYEKVPVSSV